MLGKLKLKIPSKPTGTIGHYNLPGHLLSPENGTQCKLIFC